MSHSRREFVAGAAGAAALGMIPHAMSALGASKEDTSPQAILALFKSMPEDVSVKISAPAANGKPEFLVESNSSKALFVAALSSRLCFARRCARLTHPT